MHSELFRSADADIEMMRRALAQADAAAELGEVPVGCVLTRGGVLLTETHNLRESLLDPTAHAELLAVSATARRLGDWRLTDCTVYVTLEPCPMCAGALVAARVGRLVYGADDPKAGACRSLFSITSDARLNHRLEVSAGLLAEECGDRLRRFFAERRESSG